MSTNGVNTTEDAEMADCDGEKVVTMMDVLQEQQDFEEDANAVLGASDDKNCTYSKGYIKRQAIYACMTCCPDAKMDFTKRAGVCLACSLSCHENHELVELYTKRNFRCDCGNPKFNSHPCQFNPNKNELNDDNYYNQNYSGVYCICQRPYPDPEATVEDEMIQCIICEDWLHATHLDAVVPSNDLYSEMICKGCMEKNEFLHDYGSLAVTTENVDVNTPLQNTSDSVETLREDEKCNNLEAKPVSVDKGKTEIELNDKTDVELPTEIKNLTEKEMNETNKSDNKNVKDNTTMILDDRTQSGTDPKESITKINEEKEKLQHNMEVKSEKETNTSGQIVSDKECKNSKVANPVDNTDIDKTENIISETSIQSDKEKSQSTEDSSDNNVDLLSNNEPNTLLKEIKEEIIEDNKQSDNMDKSESVEDTDSQPKSNPNTILEEKNSVANIASGNDNNPMEILEKLKPEPICEEHITEKTEEDVLHESTATSTGKQLKNDMLSEPGSSSKNMAVRETTENSESNIEHSNDLKTTIISKDDTKTDIESNSTKAEPQDTGPEPDKKIKSKSEEISAENKNLIDKNELQNVTKEDETCKDKNNDKSNTIHSNKENKVPNAYEQLGNENKRKLSIEAKEDASIKKLRLDKVKSCVRQKGIKKYKGATFWPSNFRQKLCTCNECLSMYKDLSVLFLIDPEDTVTAYETLGKERTEGSPSSQYEKGLQALSSLDRIQQINALTEYNKMRDKLLDFLKSFKERKEIVKEEDIKSFFAGMKPKREPDAREREARRVRRQRWMLRSEARRPLPHHRCAPTPVDEERRRQQRGAIIQSEGPS